VHEIAALVGGQIEQGANDAIIHGVASTLDAVEGEITFYGNPKYLAELETCAASAVLVPLNFDREITPIRIFVENPTLAFSKLVERFAPPPRRPVTGVAASAVIEAEVVLGANVAIGHHAVIETGTTIGDNSIIGAGTFIGADSVIGADCHFYPNVTIRERSVIGSRVIIHSGAVIGGDGYGFQFNGDRHVKIPQLGIVQIDDDVEIGSGTTIDRARFGRTRIKEGTKIDNLVHIGHNVVIGKHCLLVAMVGIAGSTKLGDYVTVGGHAGMAGHLNLGRGCTVTGYSGVINDVPPKAVVSGYPARNHKEFLEGQARVRRLGSLFQRVKKLEKTLEINGLSFRDT
jgi:UDP-3-O-[3-hydroxymyristoyl] glucosamine N-acyltransferase